MLHFSYCYKELKDVVLLGAVTVILSLLKIKDAALRISSVNYAQDSLSRRGVHYAVSIT